MKIFTIVTPLLAFAILGCVTKAFRNPQSENSFHLEFLKYETNVDLVQSVNLRTGFFHESGETAFKGCVIYLEGLGDSIMNHRPLFQYLSKSGYRVLAFDYMGQGGSEGKMNHSRISTSLEFQKLEIATQAKYVWNQYEKVKGANGQDCTKSRKVVIGWSTGGLVAYQLAFEGWANGVVLLAPGLHTRTLIGEAAESPTLLLSSTSQIITERTLTRNKFENKINPHIDSIKPQSPTVVPNFALSLIIGAKLARTWDIARSVEGIVFLSGNEDTYVNRENTMQTLKKKAPHFSVFAYDGALHELDNELPVVTNDMYPRITQFLDQQSQVKLNLTTELKK
ncbi:MAG: alpha/beta fold hydrolase [Bdellovibrionaceae bacterium]|nr:alpha/beta fold hydrolase [Bdellovibrio sp.]